MWPFTKRQLAPMSESAQLALLGQEMGALKVAMATLEQSQLTLHSDVQRWMRRAVNAESAIHRAGAGGGEPVSGPETPAAPALPAWGARARRQARETANNGIHS